MKKSGKAAGKGTRARMVARKGPAKKAAAARGKKRMSGTDARVAGSHTVVVPRDIRAVEDVVWLKQGHTLQFRNDGSAGIELRFGAPPAAGSRTTVYKVPAGRTVRLTLKNVVRRTLIKYAVVAGSLVHDPIVIIDPNAPTGIH